MDAASINMGWTHDPTQFRDQTDYRMVLVTWHDGWVTVVEDADGRPRCDVQHPNIVDDYWVRSGSCGGAPHHEHPHVWMRKDVVLKSISRQRTTKETNETAR